MLVIAFTRLLENTVKNETRTHRMPWAQTLGCTVLRSILFQAGLCVPFTEKEKNLSPPANSSIRL